MEENEKYEKQQSRYKWIFATILICCIAIVVTATATYYYTTQQLAEAGLKIVTSDSADSSIIDSIAATLKNFKTVIDTYYIGDIDEENLLNETIKGFVNGLGDKYSEYYTSDEWAEFEESALGNYKGIGVYMSKNEDDNIVIASVIKGSPAEEVGLKAEDVIVAINDEDFTGKTTEEASTTIKGSTSDKVKLKIYRGSEYIDFEVELREIKIYHVETEMLDNNIGYISLLTFDTGCADELRESLTDLKNQGAQKFILDLRYNTGGLVDEALDIASAFLDKGTTVLYTVDSTGKEVETKTDLESIDTTSDMVVLVNYYSASASEILTGALKDEGRATVVGQTTYGKGVIQNVFSLADGSMLKLTIAEYFTPNKTKINGIGIEPDYEVEITDDDIANSVDSQLEKAKEILNNK
jgi:carboxyl-terminal processing protease